MKTKINIYIALVFLIFSNAWGAVMENHPFFKNPPGWTECIYTGISDEMRKYQLNALGSDGRPAELDDGVFVAIPDGGKFNGYTYWALGFTYTGGMDGGPAYLPLNPSEFKDKAPGYSYHKASSGNPYHKKREGFARTRGLLGKMPNLPDAIEVSPLPDGAILPKGTLFFWWISGGGQIRLPFDMLAPLESDTLTIHTKTTPKNEFEAIWFEESETVSASFSVYEQSPEAYENQWRNTY